MMMQSKLLSSSLTIIWICDKLLVIFYDKNIHWLIWVKIEKKIIRKLINGRIIVCKIVVMMKMRRTSHQKVDTQDINEKYITWTSQKKKWWPASTREFRCANPFFFARKNLFITLPTSPLRFTNNVMKRKMAK